MIRGSRALVLVATLGIALTACGAGSAAGGRQSGGQAGGRTLTVLAASSLTEAMTAMAREFEHDHPGTHVDVSFAASSTIVQQVDEGAPADVIALADLEALKPLDPAKAVKGTLTELAHNSLEIATPPDNPGGVSSLADLSRAGLRVVLCAPQVPCGRSAAHVLLAAGVRAHVVSYERDVKAALTKVELGEADAAIVYRSDVVSARGRVRGVSIPAAANDTQTYPILQLTDLALGREFIAYARSERGRKHLRDNGFQAP